jgi:hypothetical protein
MKVITRNEVPVTSLLGRDLNKAIGKECFDASRKMTVGWAHYSKKSGVMEPHQHAEELLYILDAKNAWIRFGPAKDKLGERVAFVPGTMIHFPEMEWHVFEYAEDGYADLIFFYGQVDNIRPEDNKK